MDEIRRMTFSRIVGLVSIGLVSFSCDGSDGGGGGVKVETSALGNGAKGTHEDFKFDSPHRHGACEGNVASTGGGGGAGGRGGAGGVAGSAGNSAVGGSVGPGGRGGPGGAGAILGGGGAGGGTIISGRVAVTPDVTGWIDASTNSLGIHGPWYSFADGYGPDGTRGGQCQAAGHADSECSVLTAPDPSLRSFPNTGGRMCTAGTVAQVLVSNGVLDYSDMWGAGMGFDLAGTAVAGQPKGVFDAQAYSVIGVSFDIDTVPLGGLHVGFPTPASDSSILGPDYWGASQFYPTSPVVVGTNVVLFSQVQSPEASPQPLDVTQIESMQFLVPTSQISSGTFNYCISNVKMLRK